MWNTAVTALVGCSAAGVVLAEGEGRRVRWVRAMRRCVLRLSELVRYDASGLCTMLKKIELHATPQERQLSQMLQNSADRIEKGEEPQLRRVFAREAKRTGDFGVLSREDREPFEQLLLELGRTSLAEQLRLLDETDERLRQREEALMKETKQRAQIVRTLGLAGGATAFLLLA